MSSKKRPAPVEPEAEESVDEGSPSDADEASLDSDVIDSSAGSDGEPDAGDDDDDADSDDGPVVPQHKAADGAADAGAGTHKRQRTSDARFAVPTSQETMLLRETVTLDGRRGEEDGRHLLAMEVRRCGSGCASRPSASRLIHKALGDAIATSYIT